MFHNRINADTKISDVLNSYSGNRFMPYAWLIKTDKTAGQILSEIAHLLDSKDYVLISKLGDDCAHRLPENVTRWIRRNDTEI
jgi:hypothetical protein